MSGFSRYTLPLEQDLEYMINCRGQQIMARQLIMSHSQSQDFGGNLAVGGAVAGLEVWQQPIFGTSWAN